MKQITDFSKLSKSEFEALRSDIDQALQSIGKKYNINLKATNIRYSSSNATMKLEMSTISSSGEVVSKISEDFKEYCKLFDLQPSDLGKTFKSSGGIFKIVGLKTSAKKYPVVIQNMTTGKLAQCQRSYIGELK